MIVTHLLAINRLPFTTAGDVLRFWMDIYEMGGEACTGLMVQDKGTLRDLVHAVMNLPVPSNAG